jgi:RHH-type proline utilization regulon transcriptional repressor/proline dehydrogenase/delta 1-pyrroline-5-carboxylate dehydrogenase
VTTATSLDLPPFRNEPVAELRRASERARLTAGLETLDARLPVHVPVWIGDDRRDGDELVSTDPAQPDRVVALGPKATPADVDAAVAAARRGFTRWAARPAAERADVLLRAAVLMRERRPELAALAVRECAKPWDQADADVCEAIDFLEF